MFVDKARIFVKSGDGGDGAVSFRREKYIPLGGPDGGDGGEGGDVILVVDPNMTTLLDFKYKRKYVSERGQNGQGAKCYGRDGKDLYIKVPMGTIIRDVETDKIMADLAHKDDKFVIVKGGRGGKGNVKFCTPTRQAPNFAQPGMPGEERWISLELKLLADVGLIGFPNVGKSTLLSVASKARPKIANYHFTTITPNLGVVDVSGISSFVMADIPGIIEGASEGVGLGFEFLRHIERTRLLVHVVDISGSEGRDPLEDFLKINEELKKYNIKLWDRPQIVAANKADMVYDDDQFNKFREELNKLGYKNVFKISAATRMGVEDLLKECARVLSTIPVTDMEIPEEERFVPEDKHFTYTIRKEGDTYIVEGTFVDRLLASVNVNEPDSFRYFHKVLRNKGVMAELEEMGIKDGDMVRLNDFEFEFLK
ncbi:GTP-binding protein [Clostridium acetobutylicum]|uniref:GTPase Obg n=1 Tax=Clostridium acetobutylicum (strain ATCC 824 / DSM 792 / JCM 1419 / IAM 19013 / LMG 5710 / NBRC 13948 / NRRL B-527 / VKM B-1787 / 2291 / W) TaxID=272562 RepID=OBG_CLOAB|nr:MULTISPECIES: GTPase ObgE [Clostridium]Q97JL4.1 RecName: Full=GTPase Obg; AltName: Full=GTP-binding protein Obg [Clostridium acetobutylicum ATCC 824]AAK79231.1 SPO0B-associated GTPase, obg [Clostridium acetobutylicum ATCC 824]ADZ20311.1 GTPase ObgE [Clostridium acetobutylicum EA 2018]AEI34708.1 GTPase ObgE [Clostridium acetobutylicum DSM 1731]AWV81519.1 GTPase Obg [Clostridium acetobutylicum]MBC2393158.1 GTPase ObgE [Clostridium acetobutylicum]